MTTLQQIATIGLMGVSVVATRSLPFLLFSSAKHTPRFVTFLSTYLPSAVFGMLVVYCMKNVQFTDLESSIPYFIGVISCVLLHLWRKNMLLTIAGGTMIYMIVPIIFRIFASNS